MAIERNQLLKVEQKLLSLIDACQRVREGEEDENAYGVLVDIESRCHDDVRRLSKLVDAQ